MGGRLKVSFSFYDFSTEIRGQWQPIFGQSYKCLRSLTLQIEGKETGGEIGREGGGLEMSVKEDDG